MDKELLIRYLEESSNTKELFLLLGYTENPNARTRAKVRKIYESMGVILREAMKEKQFESSVCPVCGKGIRYRKSDPRKTCSHSCANTYFRSGVNHGNWKEDSYRTTCFHFHKKECVVCGETKIVSVHHLDENHNNNSPENLIPLCPTHHQYWHSKYKGDIEGVVLAYVNSWKNSTVNGSLVDH